MTVGPEPATRPEPAGGIGGDLDLPAGDSLVGVPLRSLLGVRSLRGLALVVLALVVVLWPGRTDRVLAVLGGLGLAVYAVSLVVEAVRHPSQRRFWPLWSIGVAAGGSAALVAHPTAALTSTAQLAGGLAIGAAVVDLIRMVGRRRWSTWVVTKVAALSFVGVILVAFTDRVLVAITSILAGLLAAAGLIEVFTPPVPGRESQPVPGADLPARLRAWIADRPDVAEDRATLQAKVFYEGPESSVRFARFTALMVFASIIAAVGVVVESTAVVIGAMLIAPLMVPLMGTSFSVAMGWPRRLRRSATVAATGVVIAISVGAVVGAVGTRTVDVTTNSEILARISPTMVDLAIAVAAGAAGAYALARRDVSDSLPGVAVAIALVPPLTVVGLCWEQGAWSAGNGALLLFLTNAAAILVAGGATFVLVGAAPLERVSANQRRMSTVVVGVLTFAGLIAMLLALNGAALARTELARAAVDATLDEWTSDHEEFRVVDRRVRSDGGVVVDISGPGRPPGLDRLVADLQDDLGTGTELTVTWTPQQSVTVGGDAST